MIGKEGKEYWDEERRGERKNINKYM